MRWPGTERKGELAAKDTAREFRLVVGIDREGSSLAVRAVGELDRATAPVLEASIREALEQREAWSIVVDLSAVGFIDLAGLQLLTSAAGGSGGDRVRIRVDGERRMIKTHGDADKHARGVSELSERESRVRGV
jgi:anti-anti-sigma factor